MSVFHCKQNCTLIAESSSVLKSKNTAGKRTKITAVFVFEFHNKFYTILKEIWIHII